ncbi:hypothetical protein M876_13270 [Elizabethkingia anophelis FMS-007]|nr:hypothetical protein M876_13270 [Elizabethkingia anophelis FMS-007]
MVISVYVIVIFENTQTVLNKIENSRIYFIKYAYYVILDTVLKIIYLNKAVK